MFISFFLYDWAEKRLIIYSSYIILGEVSTVRLKEKTNDLAVSISVLTTFVVSFTVPYLLNAPYANLGAKVGFIYGSLTAVSVIVSYFMIPEMKGRSLEEVDQLFASGVSLRRFGSFETTRVEDIGREHKVAVATEVEVARAGTDWERPEIWSWD